MWGGAAGGGKSVWLLAGALQYVDCPGYAALLLRRNFPDLSQPGGLLDLSHEWLDGTDAKWKEVMRQWTFPSGATLTFGHMDNKSEMKRYRGGEYQYVGIDEITDFENREAMFLHSRLRRRKGSGIPIRFRAAGNPGGIGHDWVRERYILYGGNDRLFIPARLSDNPHVDAVAYVKQLDKLDPITRARYLEGNWEVTEGGSMFNRSWFNGMFIEEKPLAVLGRVRAWDLAATKGEGSKYTAGVRLAKTTEGVWVVEDVIQGKWNTGERDGIIYETSRLDGADVRVLVEQEPGSGGISQCDHLVRMLAGSARVTPIKASGDKFVRAGAFASACQAGNVRLLRGSWNSMYINQLHNANPELDKKHQMIDMMDATSLGYNYMLGRANPSFAVEGEDPDEREERLFMEEEEERKRRGGDGMFPGGAEVDFWEDVLPEGTEL